MSVLVASQRSPPRSQVCVQQRRGEHRDLLVRQLSSPLNYSCAVGARDVVPWKRSFSTNGQRFALRRAHGSSERRTSVSVLDWSLVGASPDPGRKALEFQPRPTLLEFPIGRCFRRRRCPVQPMHPTSFWVPDRETIARSQLTQFMGYCAERTGRRFE